MKHPKLSIIIPALQEAARIESTLDQLASYLKRHKADDVEVILVIADSPDGTAELAAAKTKLFRNIRIIHSGPRQGKGHQVRIGMMEAVGEYKLFMDADLATPLHHIKEVRANMGKADVIIAVRDLIDIHPDLIRRFVSSAGNVAVQTLLTPGIKDSQCGFKAFSAAAAEELFSRQTMLGWSFDMELLAIARQRKLKIITIPVPDWCDKPDGVFEGEALSASVRTLGDLFVIFWRKWTGKYRTKNFTYEPNQ